MPPWGLVPSLKVLDWVWSESDGKVRPGATGLEMAAAAGKVLVLSFVCCKIISKPSPHGPDPGYMVVDIST